MTDESRDETLSNRQTMAGWKKQIAAINLLAEDVEGTKAFYREVFGLTPVHEEENLAIFKFADTYVMVQQSLQEGVGRFAILVEDVDAVRAELEAHGVTILSGPADRDWGMRTLTFADPGGVLWEIAQELPRSA